MTLSASRCYPAPCACCLQRRGAAHAAEYKLLQQRETTRSRDCLRAQVNNVRQQLQPAAPVLVRAATELLELNKLFQWITRNGQEETRVGDADADTESWHARTRLVAVVAKAPRSYTNLFNIATVL
eukprot:973843-Rhodomonas_salina.1